MSYHGRGLGQLTFINQMNTSQPPVQTKPISTTQPVTLTTFKAILPESFTTTGGTTTHRAEPALPSNYSAEAMGCGTGKTALPLPPGDPGYPGFLCIDPILAFMDASSGSGGGGGTFTIANPQTSVQTVGGKPENQFPVTPPPGAPQTDTQQPAGAVSPAAFAAACQQSNGTMGTNCCKLPNGVNVGLQNGQLVNVAQCDASGIAKSLPLIAGAAVLAMLLLR